MHVIKKVTSFPGARSIHGHGAKDVCSSYTDQQRESCVAYIETGTNS